MAETKDIGWIVGGVAVLAALGFVVYKNLSGKGQTVAGPKGIVVAAPGSTTEGAVVTPADPVVFNEYPKTSKVALWKILSMFPLVSSDKTYFSVGTTPASGANGSGASYIASTDSATPGSVYVLLSPSDGTFLFVDSATAASQAGGPSAPWSLFLRPGEWRSVSANAAADAANTSIDTSQLPSGLNPKILQQYASSVAGA